jgi:hypothetical protein
MRPSTGMRRAKPAGGFPWGIDRGAGGSPPTIDQGPHPARFHGYVRSWTIKRRATEVVGTPAFGPGTAVRREQETSRTSARAALGQHLPCRAQPHSASVGKRTLRLWADLANSGGLGGVLPVIADVPADGTDRDATFLSRPRSSRVPRAFHRGTDP